ncbi:beta strand repeat-containing protein [Dyella acidiphila]|uniref:Pre-peptidase C-terminal domain-containing protein n=1 Tax=Dyella acidiphila TaxID=2775866 RepID=A0ABR9GBR6_9GAMM|nr:PPC domain-containing protein [Dyella acidiphila]MBE1161501.1 pre-peptidase C-terminal domain-containing protein [Dyella acidiphila]
MESHRKSHLRDFGFGDGRGPEQRLLIWLLGMLCALVFTAGVQAQSTSYVHDANGRLIAVSANNTSLQYGYNTLGHANQVNAPISAGQLAIFAFMPTHGEPGAQVTLYGQGFSSTAANDSVSFNGTAAAVTSASANQLVTSVPSGATSGPVSVTVGGQTVTSATPFMIDDSGIPPNISQVSPMLAAVGSLMTVSGTHLDPVQGYTTVQMADRDMAPSSLSDTQVQFSVPAYTSSGFVTVATPYGLASSTAPIIVLPGNISLSSVTSSGVATVNGTGVSLNVGASGQYGVVAFTAPANGWATLQATSVSTSASSINYTIYGPGNIAVQQGSFSPASPSVHLSQLDPGEIYLVVLQPSGAAAQLSLGVESDGFLTTNTPVTLVTSTAGASKRVLFQASAGQNLAFQINSATTNPANHSITYTVYQPNGSSYTSAATATNGVINLGNLPSTGTYQVVVAPGASYTGTVQVEVAPGVGGVLSATPQNYAANVGGQNVYLSFVATQGENFELTLNNASIAGSGESQFLVSVYNAAGTQVTSFNCNTSNPGASCSQSLWYLPAGTYSVIASPSYSGTYYGNNKISFTALLEQDIAGPNIAYNGTASVALAAGQVERYTFNATAGDTVALNVSGITTTPGGQSVNFLIYRPDSGAITTSTQTYTSFSTSNSQTVNLSNLPVSGTYTIIVAPNYGLPSSAQLSIGAGATGTVTTDGSSQSYTTNVTGQNIYLSFTATQGQNLELLLNHFTLTNGSSNQVNVTVYNVDGAQIASFYCQTSFPGGSCSQHLWYLYAGVYSIVISPSNGGLVSLNASLQPDIMGPNIALGSTVNISLGAGQVERYTFNANVGDTVAIDLSGIVTTPGGQSVNVLVYRPDLGAITGQTPYANMAPNAAQTLNLPNLPASGAYTVIVSPSYGLPISAQLAVAAGSTGTLPANGASQAYAANVTNQDSYLSFTVGANQRMELVVNNISVAQTSNQGVVVWLYNSTGAEITSYSCNGSCEQHIWNWAAGTYTAIVVPGGTGVASFNAMLQPDVLGPNIPAGSAANVSLATGQVAWYSFNANAGDTVALNLSGITTTPSGQSVALAVYRPDAGAITTSTVVYASGTTSGSEILNLPSLPVTGAYSVAVVPTAGFAANAVLGVVGGETGSLSPGGAAQSYTANAAGENIYLSFTATQGEYLDLLLNNINVTGASSNQFYVNVYNSTGTQLAGYWCYAFSPAGSCSQHFLYLPAGTYSVVASPSDGGVITFNAQVQPDITGPSLTVGNALNVAQGAGQVEWYTFNANAGDTVVLNVAGTATTPSGYGATFQIYRPDVGAVTASTATYASFHTTGSQTETLSNLPVSGTYSVAVTADYTLPVNLQLTEVSDTAGTPPTYTTPTLPNTGVPQNESGTAVGQTVTMSFNANAGDNLELTLNNINVPGASNNGLQVNIYNPNGSQFASYGCGASNPGSSCRQSMYNLAAGTYSVVVTPNSGGTLNFTAILQPDVVGPALTMNTPVNVNLGVGQVERLTFNANVGDTVALNLSGVSSTAPSGQPVYISIYRPDTGSVGSSSAYTSTNTSSSTLVNLTNLPASGTYTVTVYTAYGTPGSAQLTLLPGATGTVTSNSAPQAFAANASGQNIIFTFNANLGDNLEFELSNLNLPSGFLQINIYGPNGANVFGYFLGAGTPGNSFRKALYNLAPGTYTVYLTPVNSEAIGCDVQLQSDTVGPALTPNVPASINLGSGQVERLTFNANSGDTVALNLSSVSTTSPTNQPVYVAVYRPDVGVITDSNYYTQSNSTGLQTLNLYNLPITGTYTVLVYTQYGTPASAQLTLVPGVVGSIASNGTPQSFSANVANQSVYFSFTANQGDNLEFLVNQISIVGANTNQIGIAIYYPSGASMANISCSTGNAGAGCLQQLYNLAAGTYLVVLTPIYGGTIHATAQLQPDIIGPTLAFSTPASFNLGAGQVERMYFNANAGDTVALMLSGISSTSPSGQAVTVYVYRPDVGVLYPYSAPGGQFNIYTYFSASSSGTLNLQNLPVSGTYAVTVMTSYGTPASGQLTLVPGATGSLLSDGTAQAFSANVVAQNVYFTFNANRGDNDELTLHNININVPGAGFNALTYHVFNPNGADISDVQCAATNPGGGCRQSFYNLAPGTYSVRVDAGTTSLSQFTGQVAQDVIGPTLSANSPASVNLASGEVERLYFNGNLGQTVTLNLSGVSSTAPTGQSVYVYVYRPDTGAITTGNYYATMNSGSSTTLTLSNLPAAGTYTLLVSTPYGTPATAQLSYSPQ